MNQVVELLEQLNVPEKYREEFLKMDNKTMDLFLKDVFQIQEMYNRLHEQSWGSEQYWAHHREFVHLVDKLEQNYGISLY